MDRKHATGLDASSCNFRLRVSELHTLRVRHCPGPSAPIIVVHGGPGGGMSAKYLRALPPGVFDVVMFDQRGCGRSRPRDELRENTTTDLVEDIERVRRAMAGRSRKWDRVCVYGASFGATLAVLYAAAYPDHTRCVVAHGFTRQRTFFARRLTTQRPAQWNAWLPQNEERTMGRATLKSAYAQYMRALSGEAGGSERQRGAVRRWVALESPATLYSAKSTKWAAAKRRAATAKRRDGNDRTLALIECHYALHHAFLPPGGVPLEGVAAMIGRVAVHLTHGADDCICSVADSKALHSRLANSHLHVIPDAGHALAEPGTLSALRGIFGSLLPHWRAL
jgi:proline iminopeptidase